MNGTSAEDPAAPPQAAPPPAAPERALIAAMLAALLATAALIGWHGDWSDPGWWMTAPFVVVWCCVPYAWVARGMRRARGGADIEVAMLGAALTVALAAWVLWDYQSGDGPRGGRVFLMLPVWQGLLYAPIALLLRLRRRAAGA